MDIAIIGGGAAGFFAAINAKENYPTAKVIIFEKSNHVLSKVKVSGGGRCNVTNGCAEITSLAAAYPRGARELKRAFRTFSNHDVMQWFEARGVALVVQEDNCVFPASQNSQTIIDCFTSQASSLNIVIKRGRAVKAIKSLTGSADIAARLQLDFVNQGCQPQAFDKVIVTTGGSPKGSGLVWLEDLGHKISPPVPSLFTFKMPDEKVADLMGIVVENALVSVQGTKFKATGSLLITHWGMSGPAILKLSAFAARDLSVKKYNFKVQVNWTGVQNYDAVVAQLQKISSDYPKKMLPNFRPFSVPERLWSYLLQKGELPVAKKWGELGKNGLHRLANLLTNDAYAVNGQTQFRDEFVTCGGVSLESINFKTMQSKCCENLYFAGEVMDIDGITGGYNFQAAWTTAFIAAKLN